MKWIKISDRPPYKDGRYHAKHDNEECLMIFTDHRVVKLCFSNGSQISEEFTDMSREQIKWLDEEYEEESKENASEIAKEYASRISVKPKQQRVSLADSKVILNNLIQEHKGSVAWLYDEDAAGGSTGFINSDILDKLMVKLTR
jgi:hypothetical protein